LSNRHKLVEFLLKHGDVPKRELAKMFNTTCHQALEAKKEAVNERMARIGPRVAYFDLETTGLRPEFDRIICGSVLSYPSGVIKTFRIDESQHNDFSDDKDLAILIRNELDRHHIICGWHSKGFDVPFLNTRLLHQGEPRLRTMLHIDPMYHYRGWHGIKPRNSKLSTVAEFWNLEDRKMAVDGQVWVRAQGGNKEAIDTLCERCESDVWLLAEVVGKTFDAGMIRNIERYA
jgi:uncharacterized protein YprB with RNaseH-like and TPR domain